MALKQPKQSPFVKHNYRPQSSAQIEREQVAKTPVTHLLNSPDYLKSPAQHSYFNQSPYKGSTVMSPSNQKLHIRSFSTRQKAQATDPKPKQTNSDNKKKPQCIYTQNYTSYGNKRDSTSTQDMTTQQEVKQGLTAIKRKKIDRNSTQTKQKLNLPAKEVLSISQCKPAIKQTAIQDQDYYKMQRAPKSASTAPRLFQKTPQKQREDSKSRGLSKSASQQRLPSNEPCREFKSPPARSYGTLKAANFIDFQKRDASYQVLSSEKNMVLKQQITPSSSGSEGSAIPSKTFINSQTRASQDSYLGKSQQQASPQEHPTIRIEEVLEFLIKEEDRLNSYSQMANQGQLIEIQSQLPHQSQWSYLEMIESVDCQKERPKIFSQQLQVSLVLANTLAKVFPPALLQRFSHKLRTVYTNVHQNFLLYIEQILNCCNINPTENFDYILLRKVIVKNLKNKQKTQRLTFFRQNNEVNLLTIKKICRSLLDQQNNEGALPYKTLAHNMLDVLRGHLQMSMTDILAKVKVKENTFNTRRQSLQNSSLGQRSKTSFCASPKQLSPRSLFLQPQRTKVNQQDTKSNVTPPPKKKAFKPKTGSNLKRSGSSVKKSPITFEVVEEYHKVMNDEEFAQWQKEQADRKSDSKQQVLPEHLALLLKNHIEGNSGVTHINNNINIYSQVSYEPNIMGKQQFKSIKDQLMAKSKDAKANPKGSKWQPVSCVPLQQANSRQQIQKNASPAKGSQKGTTGQGTSAKKSPKKLQSNLSSSKINESDLDLLSSECVGLSREVSLMSQFTNKTAPAKNFTPGKPQRPMSRQSTGQASKKRQTLNNPISSKVQAPKEKPKQAKTTVQSPFKPKSKQEPSFSVKKSEISDKTSALTSHYPFQEIEYKSQNKKPEKDQQQPKNKDLQLDRLEISDFEVASSREEVSAQDSQSQNKSETCNNDRSLQEGELRLDRLLTNMNESSREPKEKKPSESQQLKFDNLFGEHLGNFDLKKEMEKLKQLDQEQKIKRRVSLKSSIQSTQNSGELQLLQTQKNKNKEDSPLRKKLIGEFDEMNQEQSNFNLGDEMLLSRENSARHDSPRRKVLFQDMHQSLQEANTDPSEGKALDEDQQRQEDLMSSNRFQAPITYPCKELETPSEESPPHSPCKKEHLQTQQQISQQLSEEELEKQQEREEYQKLRDAVTIPYLPKITEGREYTLVLDLDETLIHFDCDEDAENKDGEEDEGFYLVRPGAIKFMQELSQYYELVIFTAAMPDYADWILDNVDMHRIIKHRLYRQHTTPLEDYAIKDLKNLGRPLEKTIIIDNLAENFIHTTPDNGIWVESWYDDMDDRVFDTLLPFLKEIVIEKVPDVRAVLTKDIKEKEIYRCLEEGKKISRLCEITNVRPSSKLRNWDFDD